MENPKSDILHTSHIIYEDGLTEEIKKKEKERKKPKNNTIGVAR